MKDRIAANVPRPHDPEEFDRALDPIFVDAALEAQPRRARVVRVVSSFLLGQGASQGINIIAGFVLVHFLSVEAYAQVGIVTGFRTVFTILMDLGFAATIVPLVGGRIHDRAVVGQYVRAARRLRDRTFWILAPIASIAFLATVHKHHWSWRLQLVLLASIILSLYSEGMASFFSAPLFMLGRLREYYIPQVISGASRLLAYLALFFGGVLNSGTASALAALNITLNGLLIRRSSRRHIDWPEQDDPKIDREFLRYVLPATPAIVFSAFQSQISLFLISIFGGTLYIAEVAALGRIGQLFTGLMAFNAIVIEPYMARLSREKLLKTFLGFVLLASLASVPVVAVAFIWPGAYLWVLGAKYEGVRAPLGWYVLSCCLNFISGLIWIMNRARKWVFWSGSILEVVLLLSIQITFLALFGVKTTQEAVNFALASSFCYLIAHGYVTVRGFIKGV